ncbi:MAG: bifunctional hydroxymethylpyrimidine kinase/phosphomethylpyrimidine kinase [Gammaproteobacteria bacterium]|nr:bifunctional hydroxymethylpyrimidine kinase/phosphomethylpyrimidine kinase [Gammaproteobacteria bacterium]
MSVSRILIIAGSDSGGGAGIQADIKTVTALQGFAMTAVTAVTAQNTLGVQAVHGLPPAMIEAQMRSVLEDIGADCLKTGMLHSPEVIQAVATVIAELAPSVPLVVDPVMVAQSGDRLVPEEAMQALCQYLIPKAALITPNIPEAEALLGREITTTDAMQGAAHALLELGCDAVLLKGGHLPGDKVVDVLVSASEQIQWEHERIQTTSDHGTGCTLASAIAEGTGRGLPLHHAIARAQAYLQAALHEAIPLGHGHGPVNHLHTITPYKTGII